MSLSRDDWTAIRDAWNRQCEEEAVRKMPGEQHGDIHMIGYNAYGALVDENGNAVTIDAGTTTYSASAVPSPELRDEIRREAARILYLLVHLDDTDALKVAVMKEDDFVAFCLEQLA